MIVISIHTRLLFERRFRREEILQAAKDVTFSGGKIVEAATHVSLFGAKILFAQNPREITGYTCMYVCIGQLFRLSTGCNPRGLGKSSRFKKETNNPTQRPGNIVSRPQNCRLVGVDWP